MYFCTSDVDQIEVVRTSLVEFVFRFKVLSRGLDAITSEMFSVFKAKRKIKIHKVFKQ